MSMEVITPTNKKIWIPLHVHSEYSQLDGAIRIRDYYDFAVKYNLPAAAITDHGNMCSCVEFDRTFSDIKPIFGCEMYSSALNKNGYVTEMTGKKRFHLNAFAKNKRGMLNLQKLLSAANCIDNERADGPFNVTRSFIEEFGKDIIFSSACISGEISTLIKADMNDEAYNVVDFIRSTAGNDNFYIEIMDIDYKEQDDLNYKLIEFARDYKIPMILTTDSHYLPCDKGWYNELVATQKKKVIPQGDDINDIDCDWNITGRMNLSLRTPEQIWEKWGQICPEAVEETVKFAEKIERYSLKGEKYMLPHMVLGNGEKGFDSRAKDGLEERLNTYGSISSENREYYLSKLEYELGVIHSMGFVEYFELVEDLVRETKKMGVKVGPGRGSAAGSVLAWSLGITEIDPVKFELIFERFLNPERISMPDIDLDFEDERRGEVIAYLKRKYGDSAVMPIITFSRNSWKNSIRDAARVIGIEAWQSNVMVKALSDIIDLSEEDGGGNVTSDGLKSYAASKHPRLAELTREKVNQIIDLAGNFNGIIRGYGRHASGIVVSPGRIDDFVPAGRVSGSLVAQYDMDGIEYVKLVKVDILGLSTLTMLKEIEDVSKYFIPSERTVSSLNSIEQSEIKKQCGTPVMGDFITYINKWGMLPVSDYGDSFLEEKGITSESLENTFDLFAKGDTSGVFQFASPGMRKLLAKIKPCSINELSAAVALYRPGPLNSGIAQAYVDIDNPRKNAQTSTKTFPESMSSIIKDIASDTRGMTIYQEHIMKIARVIAGYTMGEADLLRKAMGKKKKEVMAQERIKFTEKCVEKGISENDASECFDTIEFFAGYGFNKAHSICYAALAFITAWYAANRSPVYWASLINDTTKKSRLDMKGQNRIAPIIREAKKHVDVLPPSIIENECCLKKLQKAQTLINMDYRTLDNINDKIIKSNIWKESSIWAVKLGMESVKGVGKGGLSVSKISEMDFTSDDTVYTLVRKGVLTQSVGSIASVGPLFLNGFFDKVLINTFKSEKGYRSEILPVYARIAILEMGNVNSMDAGIKAALDNACDDFMSLGNKCRETGELPFAISQNRSVWGSFLDYIVRKLRNKLILKKNAWTDENIEKWIEDKFRPVIIALIRRATDIKTRMANDPVFKMSMLHLIYKLEKTSFGESLTIPDYAMSAEMLGWTFSLYADEAVQYRNHIFKKNRFHGNESDDPISVILKERGSIWILGYCLGAAWNGSDKGGYISLQGRYGASGVTLYIKSSVQLPIMTLDGLKKVAASGGYAAFKVTYDSCGGSFNLIDDKINQTEDLSVGFKGMPASVVILPLCRTSKTGEENITEPIILRHDSGDITAYLADTRNIQRDMERKIQLSEHVWIPALKNNGRLKVIKTLSADKEWNDRSVMFV